MDFHAHGQTFLLLVQQQSLLWDKKNANFKNLTMRNIAWRQIGNVFGLTGDQASQAFVSLRQKYIREKEKESTAAQYEATVGKPREPWFLIDYMRFLDEVIVPRKRLNNKPHDASSKHPDEYSDDSFGSSIKCESHTDSNHQMEDISSLTLSSPVSLESEFIIPDTVTVPATPAVQVPREPIILPQIKKQLNHVPSVSTPVSAPSPETSNSPPPAPPKKKTKLDEPDLTALIAAIEAPIKIQTEDNSWKVKEDVKTFCKYLSVKLDKLPDEVRSDLENDILCRVIEVEKALKN